MSCSTPRRLLALESALDAITVAVFDDGALVASVEGPRGRAHSSALLAVVDAALRDARLALAELDAIALSAGPGSFTSLRIGLATVKGLAFGRPVPVLGLSTLEVMARAAFGTSDRFAPGAEVEALALLDARRGDLYAGAYRSVAGAPGGDEILEATLGDGLYGPPEIAAGLRGATRRIVGICPEAIDARAQIEGAGLSIAAWIEGEAARPGAEWVGRVALARFARGEGETAATLSARYLRRAQAEALRTGEAAEPGVPTQGRRST